MGINLLLKSLKPGSIILLVSKADNAFSNNLLVLKELTKRINQGLLITINQPYVSYKRVIEEHKINMSKVFFIDMISATASSNPERTKECLFISAPSDLTALGIAIDQGLTSMPGEKFIFIDNLSTFLIYNTEDVMTEFTHYLINKIRLNNVSGIIMSIEEDLGGHFINKISSFCDEVINLEKKK